VSHCYERPRRATWPYNLYTMIHGRDRASCERVASRLHAALADAGIEVEPPRLLPSAIATALAAPLVFRLAERVHNATMTVPRASEGTTR